MTYNRDEFFRALLTELDAPHSDENLTALHAWGECEGSNAEFNPLDTTQPEPGDNPYNSFESGGVTLHVWNYPNQEEGVRATATTLRNGFYPHILGALVAGHGRIVQGPARDEMHTWGTNADCIQGKIGDAPVPTTRDKHKDETPTATEPTAFSHPVRESLTRVLRHLQDRENPLPDTDKQLLRDVIKAGRRVEGLGR